MINEEKLRKELIWENSKMICEQQFKELAIIFYPRIILYFIIGIMSAIYRLWILYIFSIIVINLFLSEAGKIRPLINAYKMKFIDRIELKTTEEHLREVR